MTSAEVSGEALALHECLGRYGPRAHGALVLRALLDPPWALRVQDEAPLTVIAMLRGDAWVLGGGPEPRTADAPDARPASTTAQVAAGEVVLMRGPAHYTVADSVDRETTTLIQPGGRATTAAGAPLCADMHLGVRTWGTSPDAATAMLIGSYEINDGVSQRLLHAVPAMLVLRDEALACPLVSLLATEACRDAPGQQVVLDRMLDLLVIDLLRRWLARPDTTTPGWCHAETDPIIRPALRLMHTKPAYPWTVAKLAQHAGVSRAALAKRFTALVGQPPMSYLSTWRLTLAADLIRDPTRTLHTVAHAVGYSSAFALSTAFKREHGISPHQYRTRAG